MAKNGIILKSAHKNGRSVTRAKAREAVVFANDAAQKNKTAAPKTKVIISPTRAA